MQVKTIQEHIKDHLLGLVHSYSQIFFAKNKLFGVILLLASMVNWEIGMYGIFGVVFTNVLSALLRFNENLIKDGLLGVNSSLVCMGIASMYNVNEQMIFLLVSACILCLFLNVALNGLFSRFGLPSLSTPFILAVWLLILASRQYNALLTTDGNIFLINDLYGLGGNELVNAYQFLQNVPIPNFIDVYLKSFGAILFQYNALSGLLIVLGLLVYSRISFTLSLLGFTAGYLYYSWIEGDLTQLHYSYIGFNFILYSIAIGGFFYIPNWKVYLFTIMLAPLVAIFIGASYPILNIWQLPVFSLPFVIVVNLVLYISNFSYNTFLRKVLVQLDSPEDNLYNDHNNRLRFNNHHYFPFTLPFFGKWNVSQAYDGTETHKGDWRQALDFVVKGEDNKTYKEPGLALDDFHAYNLPVLAPADGWVVAINNEVEDNEIGGVNTKENWGNSIVIKHGEHLFSQISHLKKDSFKVNINDYLKKGDVIAKLGNSGRSPEPHIHFQIQTTPYVGSKTIEYPLSAYMKEEENGVAFKSFEIPQLEDTISNISVHPLLKTAFNLTPGKKLKVNYKGIAEEWEVFTDAYNHRYIYNHNDESTAFFVNDNSLFYFTKFNGNQENALYQFYLSCYKLLLGFYPKFELTDTMPLNELVSPFKRAIYDFIAPFTILLQSKFTMKYAHLKESLSGGQMELHANIEGSGLKQNAVIHIDKNGLKEIIINEQESIVFEDEN